MKENLYEGGTATVTLQRWERAVVIKDVPAQLCDLQGLLRKEQQ